MIPMCSYDLCLYSHPGVYIYMYIEFWSEQYTYHYYIPLMYIYLCIDNNIVTHFLCIYFRMAVYICGMGLDPVGEQSSWFAQH